MCSFLAFYGNISKHSIQVEPSTTMVLDKAGKTFLPTADPSGTGTFLLKPGQQQQGGQQKPGQQSQQPGRGGQQQSGGTGGERNR